MGSEQHSQVSGDRCCSTGSEAAGGGSHAGIMLGAGFEDAVQLPLLAVSFQEVLLPPSPRRRARDGLFFQESPTLAPATGAHRPFREVQCQLGKLQPLLCTESSWGCSPGQRDAAPQSLRLARAHAAASSN